jgi:outer membrane protein assembly factor BamC
MTARRPARLAAVVLLLALVVAGGGCSRLMFWKKGNEYENAGSVKNLEVPPDLTRPQWNERYAVPGEERGGPRIRQGGTTPEGEVVAPVFEGVTVHRAGLYRWLEVDEPPEKLWPRLRAFFKEQGIELKEDDPLTGIIRTDWLEERASLPGFGIQGVINKVAGIFVGEVGIRNRFRLRVERTPSGGSAIYISSQRAELIADPMDDDQQPEWGMVPPDPEAEAEFLTRLMVYLGYNEEAARKAVAEAKPLTGPAMRLEETDAGPVLEIDAPLSEIWQTIGLSLDRAGLYVEEQNPTRHIYYFVYTEAPGRKRSFWERLTRPKHGLRPDRQYELHVTPEDGKVRITVHPGGEEAKPLKPEGQREVLERLMEALKLGR